MSSYYSNLIPKLPSEVVFIIYTIFEMLGVVVVISHKLRGCGCKLSFSLIPTNKGHLDILNTTVTFTNEIGFQG